jgi:hypothetical protein
VASPRAAGLRHQFDGLVQIEAGCRLAGF